MKLLAIAILVASAASAQTDLPGPVRSLPAGNHGSVNGFGGWDAGQAFWAGFKAAASGMTANQVWELPTTDGVSGQALGWVAPYKLGWVTTGTGSAAWTFVSVDPTGSCSPGANFQYNTTDGTPFGCRGVWSGWLTADTAQSVTALKTFTITQAFEQFVQFWNGGGGMNWQAGIVGTNILAFQDSSSVTRVTFNASGAPFIGGGGSLITPSIFVTMPSVVALATAPQNVSLIAEAQLGQVADIFEVTAVGGVPKYLWVDGSGTTHIANSDFMTTDTNQSVTSQKDWQVTQRFDLYAQFWPGVGSGGFSWQIGSALANQLGFYDSSSNLRAFLDATGFPTRPIFGTGVEFFAPSTVIGATSTDSMSLLVNQAFGSTVDVMRVQNAATLVQYFRITAGGSLFASSLSGSGTQCVAADNLGRLFLPGTGACGTGSGAITITGTAPITVGGTTSAPIIGCSTCLTTAGGQTVTSLDTFNGGISSASITPLASATYGLGTSLLQWNDVNSVFMHGVQIIASNPGANVAFETASGSFVVTGAGDISVHSCAGCNSTPCPTCLTTAGGQTISGSDTWSASIFSSLVINPGTNEIQPNGGWVLGDASHVFSNAYIGDVFVSSSVQFGNGSFLAANGTLNMTVSGGNNSQIFTGNGGNFYTRATGASTGISCSGVVDGWLAITSDSFVVVCDGGTRRRAALTVY